MARTRIHRGERGEVSWKVADHPVPPALAPYVLGLYGYPEQTPGWLRRRELPAAQVAVILELALRSGSSTRARTGASRAMEAASWPAWTTATP